MGSEWPTSRLEDLTELIVDCPHSTPKWTDDGEIVLRSQNIRNGRLDLSSPSYTDDKGYLSRIKRAIPQAEDLIFTREAPMGEVCMIPHGLKCCMGQRMVLIRTKIRFLSPQYLLYLIQSPFLQHQIGWNEGTGTTVSNIRIPNIKAFEIPLPPLPEQKAIAHILGTLDDKIELNRRMNATLEGMAQALFKSWFVDFDPVIDNALAAGNPIPPALQARAELRMLNAETNSSFNTHHSSFPSKFTWTEALGWIPEGWEAGQMSDHAFIEMGQSPRGDTYNAIGEGIPLINGPVEFGPYFTSKSKWTTSPTKRSWKGDLIVCVRGSTTGRFVKSDGEYCLGRGVCSVRAKNSQSFVDQIFKSSITKMLGLTTGSTFPNWSRQTLSGFEAIIPTNSIIDQFEELISPKIERIESGVFESATLTKLRDTLLPKLISGELRVPQAEQMVENAL